MAKVACGFTLSKQVREYFSEEYRILLSEISDSVIIEFWERDYIDRIPTYEAQCSVFKDYLLAENLIYVQP